MLTVFGVFVLRWRQPGRTGSYRTWFYPWPPVIFLALTLWTIIYLVQQRTAEAGFGFALILTGVALYFVVRSGERAASD